MAVTMNGKQRPQTNGSPKAPKALNGPNGAVLIAPRQSIPSKRRRGFLASSFGLIARLLTWYSIFTLLFRCPTSLEACDEATPKICKPYFHAKHAIAPHVIPYYDTYAAPYVDRARPFYDSLDRSIIAPGRTYAAKYGGPRVAQAQAFGRAQWEKSVQPQIIKYQALASEQYDHAISPYVDKTAATIAPYYDIARTNALQTYHEIVVPTYTFVQPYATRSYDMAHSVTRNTVIPSTVWAWNKAYTFLHSAVWPHVRDVYVLKVEPQLVRIGERLGRYKEKRPKPAVVEESESVVPKSTFVKPTRSITSTSLPATEDPAQTTTRVPDAESSQRAEISSNAPSEPSEKPKSKEEIRELAAKTVAKDLELWEGKFSQVAEEGASEIEERVDEISARMIKHHANTMGKSLITQLQTTAHSELESLKKDIVEILETDKNDPKGRDDKLAAAVRAAGLKIKNKAQNIRDWRHSYEQETEIAVTKAAQEHFTILEQTRDLALQKIGMKWAWMDGVTYKDWQKYHQLRARFDEWTEDLKRLITTHPGLIAAQSAGTNIEDEGMAIAHEAATELGRLKQVAAWKAAAEDYTDNFESSTMRLAAEAAEERIASVAKSVRSSAQAVVNEAMSGASAVAGSHGGVVSDAISTHHSTTEEPETIAVSLSRNERESEDFDTSALPPMESLATEPIDSATDLDQPGSDEIDAPEQMEETLLETPDFPIHSIVEPSGPTTVKSALFGAAAESAPTRQAILDEVVSSASSVASVAQSDIPSTITSAAQSAYTAAIAEAAEQYSRAMSAVSAQISGEPKPLHEEMFSSVSSGYFGAVAGANSRLNEALTAASASIIGTSTTTWTPQMPTAPSVDWEQIKSIAQQKFEDSVNWASDQYESAQVAVGAAEPTPSTYLEGAERRAEKLLDQAKHNYFAGVGMAHARYSEFLSAASTAASSLTATPTPTNIRESASSAISAANEAAGSVASSIGDLAGDARASVDESWSFVVSRVSSQIYGAPTPTPWYENLYAAAGDYMPRADFAVSATQAVADQMSSASSLADEYASSATSAASSQYVAVSSLVSELIAGKEPSYTESVYSRLAHAYTTGLASASSIGSVASATAASAVSKVSDAASSGIEAASEGIASATDKVKDAVDHIKDEL
ncbi:hypothetical protein F4802DRAFT_85570 [Xylaria palmicola]|nr:hypothetical protein F4802DRAFT_85570 [Xylaria palmicola]